MKYLVLLIVLFGCADKPEELEVKQFFEDCVRIYNNSDYTSFDVAVDLTGDEPKLKCELERKTKDVDHPTVSYYSTTVLYEEELRGVTIYNNSRESK
jgi:hypothetical protein